MNYPRLTVFVSSKMNELATERQAVKDALNEILVDAWVFEADAGARPQPIQQTYLEEVGADLTSAFFGRAMVTIQLKNSSMQKDAAKIVSSTRR